MEFSNDNFLKLLSSFKVRKQYNGKIVIHHLATGPGYCMANVYTKKTSRGEIHFVKNQFY